MHWSCPFVFPFCMAITKQDKKPNQQQKQQQTKRSIIVASCNNLACLGSLALALVDAVTWLNFGCWTLLLFRICEQYSLIVRKIGPSTKPKRQQAKKPKAVAATGTKKKWYQQLIIFWSDNRNGQKKRFDRQLRATERRGVFCKSVKTLILFLQKDFWRIYPLPVCFLKIFQNNLLSEKAIWCFE